ncbi:MAG: hypothetical protein P1U46_02460 [Patescibacteria group bacterium]|nr:hypothetical protein [Patescibacteria group bacterium]
MVDNSTNNKTPAFNLMLRNILKKNNIDISNNAIKERKEEISRDVNVNQYI